MRIAIFDPSAGVSGDMTLGALLSLGAPASWLEQLPARLGLAGVGVTIRETSRCGVAAKQVEFSIPPQPHGRHVGELVRLVERCPLSDWVKQRAVRAFRLIGEAEGRVHGLAPEKVHLHEVGAVDDMSPEYVEPLRQALATAGALDVQTWPVQMKKGRAGFRIEAVVSEALADAVTVALFRHSTTAGVRRWVAERATLPRRQVTVQLGPDVSVRVKVLEQPDADGVRVKPEYDDVLAAARALGKPPLEVARVAQRDAEALVAKSKE